MALKVKHDGNQVTLLVPKADEVYDAEDGQLYIPCTMPWPELVRIVAESEPADEPEPEA